MIAMPALPNGNGSQFIRNGLPKLVNVVLIVPLAFGFSKVSEQFLPLTGQAAPSDTPRHLAAIPATQKLSPINHQQIARLHLFGNTVTRRVEVKPKQVAAVPTSLNLVLRGIAAEDDKREGLAIIQQPGKAEKHFKAGDTVFGLATLEEIYPNRVILLRNGRYETLTLPRLATGDTKTRPAATTQNRLTTVNQVLPDTAHTPDKKFWEYLNYEPAIINGRVAGLELTPEEKDDENILLSKGLMPGDIITSVNGNNMKTGFSVSKAINAIADDDRLEITLTRNGETMALVVNK